MPGYRRVAARDEPRSKRMDLAPAELVAPDPRQKLKERLREEMEALRGILRKAELVVRKNTEKGRAAPAPRRGKDGRFLAAEARSEVADRNRSPCDKKRKTMPPVDVEIIKPRMMEADRIPCAKKRKTTPPMEIIEPLISKDEAFSLVTRVLSLSSNMPARIVEFLNKECSGHTNEKAGEMEIDLGSMRRSAMFELQKLLDEFAEEEKHQQQKEESMNVCKSISRSSPSELQEGEFIKEGKIIEEGEFIEEDCGATTDTCGGDARKGLCSLPRILEDGEMTEEEGVICGEAALVATAETAGSPSNSSSSGSSSSSDGSSGSSCSDASSGSSCSDSSNSDSSDTDCGDEWVTSNVAPKTDVISAKGLCSPPRILEDGEMTEEEVDICGDAGSIATEMFVETAKSSRNNSSSSSLSGSSTSGSSSSGSSCSDSSDSDSSDSGSDDECVTSNPPTAVLPKTYASPMAMPHKVLTPIAEEEFAETRNSRRNNISSLLEDGEIEEEQESSAVCPVAAEEYPETVNGTGSVNGQCVRRKRERAAAAQDLDRYLYAKDFEKKGERRRAHEKLEEMERNVKAKPIFDWIHPTHLRQLGITTTVEYAVTSERRFPARHGCPVQSLLGLFLKAK